MFVRVRWPFTGLCARCYSAQASSSSSTPPLLLKIRDDMKAAMKARDSARLDVLRGLIAETTNAAKTSSPVTTDSRMLAIIRKKVQGSETARTDFENAGRSDLTEKENAQIAILEGYIKDSNEMGMDELSQTVHTFLGKLRSEGSKIEKGSLMKSLVGPGGLLDGQLFNRKELAKLVDDLLKKP